MSSTNISHIKKSIAHVTGCKPQIALLKNYLQGKATTLHASVVILESCTTDTLCHFVRSYVDYVPGALDDARRNLIVDAQQTTFARYVAALNLAFKEAIAVRSGILHCLSHAYFTHRLIEELRDSRPERACYFTEPDMASANLIAHALLEEKAANHLDLVVRISVEKQFGMARPASDTILSESPALATPDCFAENASLRLDFNPRSILH